MKSNKKINEIREETHFPKAINSSYLQTMAAPPSRPAVAAYGAQLRMRREAEERTIAQQDLNSWFNDIKLNQDRSNAELTGAKTKAVAEKKTHVKQEPALTNPSSNSGSLEEQRLRGNHFFSRGRYEDAIQCYTRCLSNKDALESPVVYSNRGE